MFERFTDAARRVVVLAQEQARERGADRIGSEHLLLGVCQARDTRGAALLAARGVTPATVERDLGGGPPRERDLPDREALASVGIDLDEVRERVEDAFGPGALENTRAAASRRRRRRGHIPVDRDAKKVLELALREAVRRGDRSLGTEHLVLGMLHRDTGRAATVLHARGLTLADLRAALEDDAPGAASG